MTIANLLEDTPDELPALYHHCVTVYSRMYSKGERDTTTGVVTYEGFIHKLITRDLGMAGPLYSYVMNALKHMGCIKQIRRGGGSSPSWWRLITAPTPLLFRQMPDKDKTSTARNKASASNKEVTHSQMISMNNRLLQTEEALAILVREYKRLLERLIALEEKSAENA